MPQLTAVELVTRFTRGNERDFRGTDFHGDLSKHTELIMEWNNYAENKNNYDPANPLILSTQERPSSWRRCSISGLYVPAGTQADGIDLTGSKMGRINVHGTDSRGVRLIRASLRDVSAYLSTWSHVNFENADARGADFRGSKYDGCHYGSMIVNGANTYRTMSDGGLELHLQTGLVSGNRGAYQSPQTRRGLLRSE